jgi:hypothetical protein
LDQKWLNCVEKWFVTRGLQVVELICWCLQIYNVLYTRYFGWYAYAHCSYVTRVLARWKGEIRYIDAKEERMKFFTQN